MKLPDWNWVRVNLYSILETNTYTFCSNLFGIKAQIYKPKGYCGAVWAYYLRLEKMGRSRDSRSSLVAFDGVGCEWAQPWQMDPDPGTGWWWFLEPGYNLWWKPTAFYVSCKSKWYINHAYSEGKKYSRAKPVDIKPANFFATWHQHYVPHVLLSLSISATAQRWHTLIFYKKCAIPQNWNFVEIAKFFLQICVIQANKNTKSYIQTRPCVI